MVAILERGPEADRIVRAIAAASDCKLSAATLVEVGIVMQARRVDDGERDLDLPLSKLKVEIAPLTARQAEVARKGLQALRSRRGSAKLNLGDCFAYALAKEQSAALLFKGDDFRRTDVIVLPY